MTTEQLLKQISTDIIKKETQIRHRKNILKVGIKNMSIDEGSNSIWLNSFDENLAKQIFCMVHDCLEEDTAIKEKELIKLSDPLEIAMRIKKLQEQ